ncbi:MAG: M61 family metallopeptidase [Proteobacteria bacterium]|nr:M61 family metallopeptidase [Pseudomonadota bacterium]
MSLTRLILAAAALAMTAAAPAPKADPTVRYTLTPELDAQGLKDMAVEMRFTGDASGHTRLALPSSWGGQDELWRHLKDITVDGATVAEDGPAVRVLTHRPGARLTVRYRVVGAYDHDPAVGDPGGNPYRPILRPAWFSIIGNAVFAEPEGADARPADFHWGPMPKGWKTASDLDHVAQGRKTLVSDILQSTAVGAPGLKVIHRKAAGAEVSVAVLGSWSADTEAFADMLARIVGAEHAYWGDKGEGYVVTMTPMTPRKGSISTGGTSLDDGFAIFAGSDSPLDSMRYLIAHEYAHTWNPVRLGQMRTEAHEPVDYWFSEGFTDFLAYRALLRSGVWSPQDFRDELNRTLEAYGGSSARTAPNSVIVTDFWKDYAVQKLAYQRGMMLAMIWDERLRRATGGRLDMDDVLLAQARMTLEARTKGPVPTPPEMFRRAWASLGGPDLSADLDAKVERGEAVLLPADLYGDCARIDTTEKPIFDRGFDGEATTRANMVVTGVKPDSNAYAAGLRDGMKYLGREAGKPGDSAIDYVVKVDDHGTQRSIRYRPAGKTLATIQALTLKDGMSAAETAACAKRMSGG